MCFPLPQAFYRHILLDGLPFLCSTQGIGVTCHPKFDGIAPSVHDGFCRKMTVWGFPGFSKLTVLREEVLGRTFSLRLLIFRKKIPCILLEGCGEDGSLISYFPGSRWVKQFIILKDEQCIFGQMIPVFFGKYLLAAIHSNALDRCG